LHTPEIADKVQYLLQQQYLLTQLSKESGPCAFAAWNVSAKAPHQTAAEPVDSRRLSIAWVNCNAG